MTVAIDSHDATDPTTVLLLAPDVGGTAARAAAELFGDDPVDQVVAVTVGGSAATWLDEWERHAAPTTAAVTCVDVDGDTRSAAGADATDGTATGGTATVERVRDPRNLERVGRRVSDVLQRADEEDERVGLTVHSVSDVLQHVDESTAFKFVYTLGEVVRKVDGTAYFHLDPESHDRETVETFSVVCDAVAELDCDLRAGDAGD